MQLFSRYYQLTKPGIVYGNVLHTFGGVMLGFHFQWQWGNVIGVIVGTGLVIMSACMVNNYFDRDYDKRMERTKKRGFAEESVNLRLAFIQATLLLSIGLVVLWLTTNNLTVGLALIAFVSYAGVYTYLKHHTAWATLVGTLPGSLPAVAGYTALSGQLDSVALMIFLVIALWQLPHFFAISLFRKQDYVDAGLPVPATVLSMRVLYYLTIFTIGCYLGAVIGLWTIHLPFAGGIMLFVVAFWWWVVTLRSKVSDNWGRKVFGVSMLASLVFVASAVVSFVLERWSIVQ